MREKIDIFEPCPNIDKMLEELSILRKGYDFLVKVYFDSDSTISRDLRWKIEDFFGHIDYE